MKPIYFHPHVGYYLTEAWDWTTSTVEVPEWVWAMVDEWQRRNPADVRDLSGVMADWFEDHMDPTPEMRHWVMMLRRWFDGICYPKALEAAHV